MYPSRINRSDLLDQVAATIPGNHLAKQMLVDIVIFHDRIADLNKAGIPTDHLPPKLSPLLIGPRSDEIARFATRVAQILDKPIHQVHAMDFPDAAESVVEMVGGLFDRTSGDIRATERGIVLIHDIDVHRRRYSFGRRIPQADAFQRAAVALINGGSVFRRKGALQTCIRTNGILFIAAGSFDDLGDTVRRRLQRAYEAGGDQTTSGEMPFNVTIDDLVDFGFVPNFAALFSIILTQQPTVADLHKFQESDLSPLAGFRRFFSLHGIRLVIQPAALDAIINAESSCSNDIQANLFRLLHSEIGQIDELRKQGIGEVYIDRSVICGELPPWRVPSCAAVNAEVDELLRPAEAPHPLIFRANFSNTTRCSDAEIQRRLEAVKSHIGYDATVKRMWDNLEKYNAKCLGCVLKLAEELALRHTTISEFFAAKARVGTDDCDAILQQIDDERLLRVREFKDSPKSLQ